MGLQILNFGLRLYKVQLSTSHCYYNTKHIPPVNKLTNFEKRAYGQHGNSSELMCFCGMEKPHAIKGENC